MYRDPVVSRRFGELLEKGQVVLNTKIPEPGARGGGLQHYKVRSDAYREWITNVLNLVQRTCGESSIHFRHLTAQYGGFSDWESHFADSFSLFKAAKEDYDGGYLFNVRTLAKAEVLFDAMSQAKELLYAGYKDPACILARVSLEVALKDLCDQFGVSYGKLEKMNVDLCKLGAYNMGKQKLVTAWADIGNKAAHGDWSSFTEQDAIAMVQGVDSLVKDLLEPSAMMLARVI